MGRLRYFDIIKNRFHVCTISILFALLLSACSVNNFDSGFYSDESNVEESSNQIELSDNDEAYEAAEDSVLQEEQIQESDLESELVDIDVEKSISYCTSPACRVYKESNLLEYTFWFNKGVPRSDDDKVYLFEIATYEDDNLSGKVPIAIGIKDKLVKIKCTYEKRYLFERFVPALLFGGEYIPLANSLYISNIEELACNREPYPEVKSKKGLLLDGATVGSDFLTNLNVKRLVYNVPLSLIVGETDNADYPTIEYEYNGRTYLFNGHNCAIYDALFTYLTDNGYHSTAIILNDWNDEYIDLIHPASRNKTKDSLYYAFNTEEEDGVRLMEATALFLAQRYSNGSHGIVCDWVIANEVNQQRIWNYMNTDDLEYYTRSFEKSFRTFYNAIKSSYSEAKVYFSIDHDWNDNKGNDRKFFNGRDLLYAFNEYAKESGNYDWGVSIHPYPNPLPNTKFWVGNFSKDEDAPVVTPMNMTVVTDMFNKSEFLDTKGHVRDISVTELGFSSVAGERYQAAAFAYCYYIIEDNEYINAFLMNRQTDDLESLESGLALGIYNNDYSSKYIADVFSNIDSGAGRSYVSEMLDIIGADSLEEALSWAR